MAGSKQKLLFVLDIMAETDEAHPITAPQICRRLAMQGIVAERKSVCRDIDTLREHGYDILLSPDNKEGFYLASRPFEDWELKVLTDAVWQANFLSQKDSAALAKKLSTLTSVSGRELLRETTPVHSHRKTTQETVKYNIDLILQAVRKNRQMQFQYIEYDAQHKPHLKADGKVYTVNPYALLWHNQRYYLVCNADGHDNLAHFRVDKITAILMSENPRRAAMEILGANPDLQLDRYEMQIMNMYTGEPIQLVLRVPEHMTSELTDHFGNTFTMQKETKSEKYLARISTTESNGLYYWLLQCAAHIEVVEPLSVRETLVGKIQEMLTIYKKG